MQGKKSLYYLLCTQAVECKAPVTVIKIEGWKMRDTLTLSTNNQLRVVNSCMHSKSLSFFIFISKRPLTGSVRINSLGNSRGVPSFFSQSQKTAMLFLFQKQAPVELKERRDQTATTNSIRTGSPPTTTTTTQKVLT